MTLLREVLAEDYRTVRDRMVGFSHPMRVIRAFDTFWEDLCERVGMGAWTALTRPTGFRPDPSSRDADTSAMSSAESHTIFRVDGVGSHPVYLAPGRCSLGPAGAFVDRVGRYVMVFNVDTSSPASALRSLHGLRIGIMHEFVHTQQGSVITAISQRYHYGDRPSEQEAYMLSALEDLFRAADDAAAGRAFDRDNPYFTDRHTFIDFIESIALPRIVAGVDAAAFVLLMLLRTRRLVTAYLMIGDAFVPYGGRVSGREDAERDNARAIRWVEARLPERTGP